MLGLRGHLPDDQHYGLQPRPGYSSLTDTWSHLCPHPIIITAVVVVSVVAVTAVCTWSAAVIGSGREITGDSVPVIAGTLHSSGWIRMPPSVAFLPHHRCS